MTTETRTAEEEILHRRSELVEHLIELCQRAKPRYVRQQALAAIAPSSSPVWPAIGRKVADHPVGFAITLAGLAYIALGPEPAPPSEQVARLKHVARGLGDRASAWVQSIEDMARPIVEAVPQAADRAKAVAGDTLDSVVSGASSLVETTRRVVTEVATGTSDTVHDAADYAAGVAGAARDTAAEVVNHDTLADNITYIAAAAFAAGFAGGVSMGSQNRRS